MLLSPVITYLDGLYKNGDPAHVHSWYSNEVVNVEILQKVFASDNFGSHSCSLGIRDYANSLVFKIGRGFRFD